MDVSSEGLKKMVKLNNCEMKMPCDAQFLFYEI